MASKIYIQALLKKFVENRCSKEEQTELFNFLNTPEGQYFLRESMDVEWDAIEGLDPDLDPAVSQRIMDKLHESVTESERNSKRRWFADNARVWRVAASLIGFLIVFGLGQQLYGKFKTYHYATEKGQRRTIILPDGSRVSLNNNSTLTFNSGWNSRNVTLSGEAYFDVSHDKEKPFFVKTSEIEIKVLGTAFNVNAYQSNKTVETMLIRGRVLIKDISKGEEGGGELVLSPNEVAFFDRKQSRMTKASQAASELKFWHHGNLVFEDEPLHVIIPELEKWFDTRISIDAQSRNCRFSLNIDRETLPEVMKLFEVSSGAKLEFKKKEVRLSGALCH
jgi:transmembrane sensor